MFDSKTRIDTLECELSEEDLMTVVGGAKLGNNDLFPKNYIKTEVGTGTFAGSENLDITLSVDLSTYD